MNALAVPQHEHACCAPNMNRLRLNMHLYTTPGHERTCCASTCTCCASISCIFHATSPFTSSPFPSTAAAAAAFSRLFSPKSCGGAPPGARETGVPAPVGACMKRDGYDEVRTVVSEETFLWLKLPTNRQISQKQARAQQYNPTALYKQLIRLTIYKK